MYVPPRLLLEREKEDLLDELRGLPNNAVIRRINELVKRARSVKVHSYIIHYLRKQARVFIMPTVTKVIYRVGIFVVWYVCSFIITLH